MTTTIIGTPGIEYKSVDTQARNAEVTDLGKGMIEAIVSVTGIKDNVNDIIVPGAFTKSLKNRIPKGVWHHSWQDPIAKTHEIKELMPGDPLLPSKLPDGKPWPSNAGALYVKMEFNLQTDKGKNAYEDVKFFADAQEWSIGYKVPEKKSFRRGGVRHIEALDLYEYSPVLFGAMSNARTTTVKDAQLAYKSLMQDTEGTVMDKTNIIEMKSALAEFADQFHSLVEQFAVLVGETEGKSDSESVEEIALELGLEPELFEDFQDAIDEDDYELAQEKAVAIMDELEGKRGPRVVTVLESVGLELKALEKKPGRPAFTDDDDEDDDDEFDDIDPDDEDDDDEDDDDDDEEKSFGENTEYKMLSVEEIERYLN